MSGAKTLNLKQYLGEDNFIKEDTNQKAFASYSCAYEYSSARYVIDACKS